jgi:3-dehydroquinate dehydratase II
VCLHLASAYISTVRIDVLNGVNLDVLGKRDPTHYGGLTLGELETRIYDWASALGCTVRCRQTNHEGEYIEWCHDVLDGAEGLIANPGAWSHYSWAIRDALELVRAPIVEVHLSDVDQREEWRRQSVLAGLTAKRIVGKGPEGYHEALMFLAERS